ncbi:uncharacterized protein LOC117326238 isoform X1 [Pecten maximus]|uniref:uncharacterized protein LOC117326238 isoform X1 n=1 Tax=Pecten maximus TaxID=6579 RepID=UPI001457E820|nr:uncharacterized protein LOC117326238 isoform X1 [Pecten maximus]XP_033738794.1 uncharacterized protein LOC117326238 isoform X1 [Pecten maximus]XP_033738795.1 uncharacterized protein LOC117326238 isoform X1 [Pecten maximus]XP_033738796.1 uncharacterized protein LOC117326238 isoform X1 [Pecten maximus]
MELSDGFENGFRLHYQGPRQAFECNNLQSARSNPDQLVEKLNSEINLGRIAGPFKVKPFSNLRISPIGLVPKKSGGWRMITNLSYPKDLSVNDFINPDLATTSYTSFDKAIEMVLKLGKGAFLGKKDIKSAFRLLPIHPDDFVLLGMKFQDNYYFDKCLPMGCSISCSLFENFSTFLEWLVIDEAGHDTVEHYLDDFLFGGAKSETESLASSGGTCQLLMDTFDGLCYELGIPVADEKTEGPTTCLSFWGLEIDTIEMVVRVPLQKVQEVIRLIDQILPKVKVRLKELQSLAGSLAFCTRAMPGGRAFCRRIYGVMSGVSEPHYFIRITKGVREDLQTWLEFFKHFNGICYISEANWLSNADLQLYTDSAGNAGLGCGAILGNQWFVWAWPSHWAYSVVIRDITFLELVPIALAICVWADSLKNKKVIFHCDNLALVNILNNKTSKSERVMKLLRPLVILALRKNVQFKARHVPGVCNSVADALSRFQWCRFRRLAPCAYQLPCTIPQESWDSLKLNSIL